MTRTVENCIIHQSRRNIRLPIGGRTVYVSRREAHALAQLAQANAILGRDAAETVGQLLAALEQMRSVANNPLLVGAAGAT